MILIIDNYDSFTYNLVQAVETIGFKVKVALNDAITISDVRSLKPEMLILSPGPGRPEKAGISMNLVHELYRELPILGVCLGHQAIGAALGVHVVPAFKILHGKTSSIFHDGSTLFKGLGNPFIAARYHSLVVDQIPDSFIRTAWDEGGDIMAMQHVAYPMFGVQFHPESFLTENGPAILENFLNGV